jgi:hypothetical protein
MAKQSRDWRWPEAKEALRHRLLDVRERYGPEFSLSAMANETGVSIEIIKGFARMKHHPKATTPRAHKDLDAIAKYISDFETEPESESGDLSLSHPGLIDLFGRCTPENYISRSGDYRGLYVGMAVGRKFPNLFTSVLAIDACKNRLDYAEHDVSTIISSSIEGQCFFLSGKLVLFGVNNNKESVQVSTLRSESMIADTNRIMVGAEYHTGWSGGGSPASRVVFVQVAKRGFDKPLMDELVECEAISLLRDVQPYHGFPEDIAWERLITVLTQIFGDHAAEAAINKARSFIGPFDQASDLI